MGRKCKTVAMITVVLYSQVGWKHIGFLNALFFVSLMLELPASRLFGFEYLINTYTHEVPVFFCDGKPV